ncbi:hypothetical protein FRC06_009689 [Ceratobasidium sp. 370]|nr:hypothetical protein FRC06_009689 [Ceratobasidium sp. 370]
MSDRETELGPVGESALESSSTEPTPADPGASTPPIQPPRVSALSAPKHARVSFSRPPGHSESPARYPRRPSRGANSIFGRSSARRADDNDAAGLLIPPGAAGSIHERERPAIPSALNPSSDATPLPILSMIVLSIVMLGEFLSANVSTPFVVKMVGDFFADPGNNPSDPNNPQENEADVGYWTGILVSVFFITQFITSLLWATVADKHGRRAVLFVSLLGNALTCTSFGFATNLPQAILIRLAQGVFNGAVGVARGTVASITDTSNEGRAYAIMGFSWGFGGVAGAIIGGALESPADKWPAAGYALVSHPDDPLVVAEAGTGEHLAPIMEARHASSSEPSAPSDSGTGGTVTQQAPLVVVEERPVGALSQLPVVIIFQYGLLALHNTTHDQIFLSYLVSKYKAGGLGLDPGHFAQLIALMCLAQIVFQFYLYPNIGPPLGRFSHLAMFRIGCALFIPSYLSVVLYRHFASADNGGGLLIMILLSVSTAIRYCGTTFSYTSVAVLLNYMSPPHVVSLSNGMAQSIVSLARFIGPVFGGYLWSVSVQDNPSGYGFGFYVCSVVCGLSILHSFTIR